ncbi:hypothetical protein LCGC14_0343560 [marine sediment metagenome]|uniref:Uncharacterized protein n=1 Tax=marine sediment metagenome TaxID=412755 RepID=A0A0F9WKX6_9ZZZZ
MDSLDHCAEMDKLGPLSESSRVAILSEHCHTDVEDWDATKGMTWVEFYKWLGY